ncbi:MAG: response regulator [Sphingomonas fennica]
MPYPTSRTPLLPLFGLVIVLLAAIAAIVLGRGERAANRWITHTVQVQLAISETTGQLTAFESAYRGYLLEPRPALRQDMRIAQARLDRAVARVMRAVADNPEQRARLAAMVPLVLEKQAVGRAWVRAKDAGQMRPINHRAGHGRELTTRIRAIAAEMTAAEDRFLAERRRSAGRLSTAIGSGLAAAVLLVVVVALLVLRDARLRMVGLEEAHREAVAARHAAAAEAQLREAAEGQLRHIQRLESIGQLTGGIAHDFNNMLAVIIGGLDLARRRLESGETARAATAIAAAMGGAERSASLVARLLAFARRQPLAPVVLDVNRLVSSMSDLLHRSLGERVGIETVQAGGLWRAHADPVQLENAILNLAVNARDAMEAGGGACHLTIETANAWLDDDYAARHSEVTPGQYVMISVSDTGGGMDADTIARAFEPFFTTKTVGQGTGLGLSQVFGFIKQSHGHVAIYSEAGRGTVVKLYLPRHHGEPLAEAAAAAADEPAGDGPGARILVVEDEQRVRQYSVEALTELGYRVAAAGSGEEALTLLAADRDFAMVFTDVVMPGMDGRRLADAVAEIDPGIAVLFTTGYSRNAVVHNGTLDADVAFLQKPFTIAQLSRKVKEVLATA